MTLEEIVYQIGGQLVIENKGGGVWMVVSVKLLDKISDVCTIMSPIAEEKLKDAVATGSTLEEARNNLATMLKGTTIEYSVPIMWDSTISTLHIPPTLTADEEDKTDG